ncbi:PAS domain-containing protein [Desulfocicer vacuolatum DSM 3385]|uniref:histidine kinase n=1 Tax=Desulfocicer vacuolatum DSM 3385 TaxID=1121400 RepID=A0A1W2DX04_9BACT|nr:PAS domain-containing sensor histidine kinase [Desulfocicer vacuolatum]SMD02021.1 PAS domain-containing protein [Desulfocicer vacuolatum DSM 3385]
MKDNMDVRLPPVFYEMAFDFLREVMQTSDNPKVMSGLIAEKYRELTGAKTVLFFQNLALFGGSSFRILTVDPQRRGSLADKGAIIKAVHRISVVKDAMILKSFDDISQGDLVSMGIPLLNNVEQNLGVIMILDFPDDPRHLPLVLESLKFLTGYISPVFHNALTHEFQELLLAEKTRALENEIQQRKQMQEHTDRQKILLETIINAIPSIICLKDGGGRWIIVNEYSRDLFQIRDIDYIGKTNEELADLNPFYQEALLNGVSTDKKAWELKKNFQSEEIIPRPDGFMMTFDMVKIPLFHSDGRPYALVVAGLDVTERKKAERILKQAKDEWEKTFDAISDIITIIDKDYKVVRANKAARGFFWEKHREKEPVKCGEKNGNFIIGMHCYDLFRKISHVCPECPKILASKEKRNYEKIVEHKDLGKVFHVSSCPILDENNEISLLVHVAKDITEQKRLEEELFQAHKMEAMGTLAGGIAHDFNNILSAIIGFSELAITDVPRGSDVAENLDEVLKASRRAADLVKQILSFSRKSDMQTVPLLPQVIVKEALKMLRSSIPTTIEIQEDIDDECGRIMADPTSIHQIVVNLCTNAQHAMAHEKGRLTVSVHQENVVSGEIKGVKCMTPGSFAVIKVSDTGHGIAPGIRDRIFEPYFTTKSMEKGTGLGLAVVHGIVKTCNGSIRMETKTGQGTTFYVYFPLLSREMPRFLDDKPVRSIQGGGLRILVVDDEPMILKLNTAVLEKQGHKVTAFINSVEALEQISREPQNFDLVITDQTMPGMTGVELAEHILTIRAELPIILCTGYSAIISEAEVLAVGIKKYLRKPVSRSALYQAINDVFK